jgi:hypothetical protein
MPALEQGHPDIVVVVVEVALAKETTKLCSMRRIEEEGDNKDNKEDKEDKDEKDYESGNDRGG